MAYDNTLMVPPPFFALMDRDFGPFDIDVCAAVGTNMCKAFFSEQNSCFDSTWGPTWGSVPSLIKGQRPCRAWMNPPYAERVKGEGKGSGVARFVRKALDEALAGHCSTVCIFPAKKTEHTWYHEIVIAPGGDGATAIYPVHGRLDFWRNGAPIGQPNHASVIVVFEVGCVEADVRRTLLLPLTGSIDKETGLVSG